MGTGYRHTNACIVAHEQWRIRSAQESGAGRGDDRREVALVTSAVPSRITLRVGRPSEPGYSR